MLINRPFPGFFGGVSQQIPALRAPNQAELADNCYLSMVDGLMKRPGSLHVGDFAQTSLVTGETFGSAKREMATHIIDQGSDGKFVVMIGNSTLRVFDMENAAEHTVTFTADKTYLSSTQPYDNYRMISVADYTFVVNRLVTPAATCVDSYVNDNRTKYARVLTVPGANITYSISCDAAAVTVTSVATDNTNTITAALVTALGTALGGNYTVTNGGNGVVRVQRTAVGAIYAFSVDDGWGQMALRNLSKPLKQFSDLPPNFDSGVYFTITTDEIENAAYYVQYDSNVAVQRWVECRIPDGTTKDTFTASTMPHVLVRTGATTWEWKRPAWKKRLVGDEDSNPTPSFIGMPIQDVFFFRNRLGFLGGDTAILSKAGEFFDFWSDTARDVLDSDPIDVSGTTSEAYNFSYAVPFSDNLLIFADRAQLTLTGADALTPKTVKLTTSTAYPSSPNSRPVLVGNELMFVTESGSYSTVQQYKVTKDGYTYRASDLTDHCPKYVASGVSRIIAHPDRKLALLFNRDLPEQAFAFKWESDEEGKFLQRAWSRWTIQKGFSLSNVCAWENAVWSGSKLYILFYREIPAGGTNPAKGQWTVESIDFEDTKKWTVSAPLTNPLGYFMDRRWTDLTPTYDAGTNRTSYTTPFWTDNPNDYAFYVFSGAGAQPTLYSKTLETDGRTTFVFTGDQTGREMTYGVPIRFDYTLSQITFADRNNLPVPSAKLRVKRVVLHYQDTGYFKVLVTPKGRGTYTYVMSGALIGSLAVNSQGIATGDHQVAVGTRPDGSIITIQDHYSYTPTRIPYGEWTGQLTMTSSR